MRTPGTQGSRDALNWGEVVNGPLGGRNASQAHAARSDSDSPVDHDDDCRTPARHDPPLRRRWRLCQQLYKIYASLSKELLAPWGGVEFTNGKRFGTNLPQAGIDLGENGSIFPRPKGKTR
jgi:hypothetical protein